VLVWFEAPVRALIIGGRFLLLGCALCWVERVRRCFVFFYGLLGWIIAYNYDPDHTFVRGDLSFT